MIDREAIRARVEKATPGPWRSEPTSNDYAILFPDGSGVALVWDWSENGEKTPEAVANADFIAHARTDIPALLAEVDRLREALKPFARYAANMDRRADDEITSVEIELSAAESQEVREHAIKAGVPADAFLSGPDYLAVSLDGLLVKHWRAASAALNPKE